MQTHESTQHIYTFIVLHTQPSPTQTVIIDLERIATSTKVDLHAGSYD